MMDVDKGSLPFLHYVGLFVDYAELDGQHALHVMHLNRMPSENRSGCLARG